jgi:hypothetical protein
MVLAVNSNASASPISGNIFIYTGGDGNDLMLTVVP